MKRTNQRILSFFAAVVLIMTLPVSTSAHSGRTDSSGGHKDNKNKSGLGSYHYHCGGYPAHLHDGGYCPYTDVMPSSVRVTAEKTTLKLGEKVSISGSVYPENSCNTSVSWACSDESVIKLTNGYIEAVGYGTATITVTSFNNKVGAVKITVQEIQAKSIAIEKPEDFPEEIYIGHAFPLMATIAPAEVDNPAIIWQSSDESIATVSSDGTVTPIAAGDVVISATTSNGKTDEVEISVLEIDVETIEIKNGDSLDLLIEESAKLDALVLPTDASFPEITWETSDAQVIAVESDGKIHAVGCGNAVITASVKNGLSDNITVEVTEIVAERLDIEGESKIRIGSECDLIAIFYPVDTTIKTLSWTSSDEAIASIDDAGHIMAHNVGTVKILAVAKDVQAEIEFTVEPILVDRIDITTNIGEKFKAGDEADFTATVYPENATYPAVTWSTDNTQIATIDSDGHLVAESFGKVSVIAQTEDGCTETFELSVGMSNQMVGAIAGGAGVAGLGGVIAVIRKAKKKKSVL